jgi:hypothetical protein
VRLRAKTRWGELLGEAETGRPKNVTSGNDSPAPTTDRVSEHRARKLAAVKRDFPEQYEAALVVSLAVRRPACAPGLGHRGCRCEADLYRA